MSISAYVISEYEDSCGFGWRKNKAKQSQYDRTEDCVLRTAKVNLKKQSQFVPGQNGATSYMKGDYDNIPVCRAQKTKPNKANLIVLRTECCVLRKEFEKTKPICQKVNWRKFLFERKIW